MTDRYSNLEAVFGGPSDDAFGSAVFRRPITAGGDMESIARGVYQDFIGELWDRFGADAWLSQWKEIASRDPDGSDGVMEMLQSLADPSDRSAVDTMLNGATDPQASRSALEGAFDHASVVDLKIYRIGDGEAISGILVVASDRDTMQAIVLGFLMD